jgi:hypothetical protein
MGTCLLLGIVVAIIWEGSRQNAAMRQSTEPGTGAGTSALASVDRTELNVSDSSYPSSERRAPNETGVSVGFVRQENAMMTELALKDWILGSWLSQENPRRTLQFSLFVGGTLDAEQRDVITLNDPFAPDGVVVVSSVGQREFPYRFVAPDTIEYHSLLGNTGRVTLVRALNDLIVTDESLQEVQFQRAPLEVR